MDFSVTVGTVYERSHIPLNKWLLATYLLCSSKKGMSSHQLHRTIGVTYKTAWFMTHRIRDAMAPSKKTPPMGGKGKADETFFGGLEKNKHASKRKHIGRGGSGKEIVFSLVERGGKVRSNHVKRVTAETFRPILDEQLQEDSRLMTDEARHFIAFGKNYADHQAVNHGIGEYIRGDVHTNTTEGYFSIFKPPETVSGRVRLRYNEREALGIDDDMRTAIAVRGMDGKRLTYCGACEAGSDIRAS